MNSRNSQHLAAVVHRGKDDGWVEEAVAQRRRQIRRRRWAVLAALLIGSLVIFLLSDGLRRTGILDATGMTCGEFVHEVGVDELQDEDFGAWESGHGQAPSSNAAPSPFRPWEQHWAQLQERFEDSSARLHAEEFETHVQHLRENEGMTPVLGAFRAWEPGDREFVASAVGDHLVVGQTPTSWSVIQGLLLIDAVSGEPRQISDTEAAAVVLDDPTREDWEEPRRMLMGIGAWGEQIGLQTHAVSGDTDLVIWDVDEGSFDCQRLEGAQDETERLEIYPRVLMRTVHLTNMLDERQRVLILHGAERERQYGQAQADISLSAVALDGPDAELLEAEMTQEQSGTALNQHLLDQTSGPDSSPERAVETSWPEAELVPLGSDHWLLDWQYGYLVLEQS